jgi:glycosyltransferase involved in cell wall biosynthesis
MTRENGGQLTVGIVVPVYNEGKNIERTLDAMARGMGPFSARFTVSIVYDREDDDTLPVLKSITHKYPFPVRPLRNQSRGACGAIKTGLSQAGGDYVLVSMADMSDDYSILPAMLSLAEQGYDIICASRYMKGGAIHGGPFLKQGLSRLAGLTLHWLKKIPTRDITNSYKMYRRGIFERIRIESSGGFELGMEITAKAFALGYRITELPSHWWDRTEGKSRFRLMAWLPCYLRWYFFVVFS